MRNSNQYLIAEARDECRTVSPTLQVQFCGWHLHVACMQGNRGGAGEASAKYGALSAESTGLV